LKDNNIIWAPKWKRGRGWVIHENDWRHISILPAIPNIPLAASKQYPFLSATFIWAVIYVQLLFNNFGTKTIKSGIKRENKNTMWVRERELSKMLFQFKRTNIISLFVYLFNFHLLKNMYINIKILMSNMVSFDFCVFINA
jgi:hypothetical protein